MDDNGEQLGILAIRDALQLAQERDLDLVEVAPNAVPPVCRLLDYGKFRYLQTKREKEARRGHKVAELAEVRMRPSIGQHDLDAKVHKIKELLGDGHKVKVSVMFRGREITHPELGVKLLKSVTETVKDVSKLERAPLMEGRFLSVQLTSNVLPEVQKVARAADEDDDAQAENP